MDNRAQPSSSDIDDLFSIAYAELRRIAASVKRGDQSATLNPTALVNEAWMRLRNSPGLQIASPVQFKRIAARAMRQILVEAARKREAQKRGGDGFGVIVPLDEAADAAAIAPAVYEMICLDQALTELEHLDPRQAQLVEARFFGGLEVPELTQLFGISEATIMRDWRLARAWLAFRIKGTSQCDAAHP